MTCLTIRSGGQSFLGYTFDDSGIGVLGGSFLVARGLDDVRAGLTTLSYPDAPPAMTYTFTAVYEGAKWLGASESTATVVGFVADIGLGLTLTSSSALKIASHSSRAFMITKGLATSPRQILKHGFRNGLYRSFRKAGISTTYSRRLIRAKASRNSSCFVEGTLVWTPNSEFNHELVAFTATPGVPATNWTDQYQKWLGLSLSVALMVVSLKTKTRQREDASRITVDYSNLQVIYF